MEIENSPWLVDFFQVRQDITEDALLLEALSVYMSANEKFIRDEQTKYISIVFCRLCDYLSQHVQDLCHLEHRLGLEPQ